MQISIIVINYLFEIIIKNMVTLDEALKAEK